MLSFGDGQGLSLGSFLAFLQWWMEVGAALLPGALMLRLECWHTLFAAGRGMLGEFPAGNLACA